MLKSLNSPEFGQKSSKIDDYSGQKLAIDNELLEKISPSPKKNLKEKKSNSNRSKTDREPVIDITGSDGEKFDPHSILQEKFEAILAARPRVPKKSAKVDKQLKEQFKINIGNRPLAVDPAELGEEYYDKIRKLASTGMTQRQIAAYLGMAEQTWYQNCQKYPELRIAVKQGCARAVEALALNAYKRAMDGDTALTIFLLKTVARFSESFKQNEHGDDEPATPTLAITVTDPIEAMQQYDRIMKD